MCVKIGRAKFQIATGVIDHYWKFFLLVRKILLLVLDFGQYLRTSE